MERRAAFGRPLPHRCQTIHIEDVIKGPPELEAAAVGFEHEGRRSETALVRGEVLLGERKEGVRMSVRGVLWSRMKCLNASHPTSGVEPRK